MDLETFLFFPAGSTGHVHLLDDHYIKVAKLMANFIKVLSYWIVGEFVIVI